MLTQPIKPESRIIVQPKPFQHLHQLVPDANLISGYASLVCWQLAICADKTERLFAK